MCGGYKRVGDELIVNNWKYLLGRKVQSVGC